MHQPKDGYEPVSLWLLAFFAALIFWGGWYLANYSGGFRPDVLDETPQALYAGRRDESPKPVDPFVLGQRLFATAGCVSCHQANGAGVAGLVPPLARSEFVLGGPARLKRVVLHGLSGRLSVGGAAYNNDMPAFAAKLKDEHLAAILTYIRTNADWGNSASPISPESVGATRVATKDRARPWSAPELLAVTTDDYTAAPSTQSTTHPAP
jgi:mono/diheme cytochrome c family protein